MISQQKMTEIIPLEVNSHGVLCVSGTRVTLDTIVTAFSEGATAEEIAQQYPSVPLSDIYYVIGYYLRNYPETEAYLNRRRQKAEYIRKENEARFNPVGIHERLLARMKG